MQFKVKENLSVIQEEIAPYKPNIIAVTKYFDEVAIEEAYQAGMRDFAESRAIEAIEKIGRLPEDVRKNSTFHFIGHLQSNKVKKVVEHFDLIHSIDTLRIAGLVSEASKAVGKVQRVLLQLNNAGEIQKSGFSKEELFEVFSEIIKLDGVKVEGLMCMTPLGADENVLRTLFEEVRETRDALEKQFNCNMKELSMGMSQDYKIAAQTGATMLRIGRKLFG
ncbi:YggS family pyridoxal phosphate-dependent enzyme [bacterium]|nr:YggS family pyridoxal phosphate-dependent enzyme [bacterium]